MRRLLLTTLLLSTCALTAFADTKTRNVAIYIYDGAEILDFTGPAEVLAAASHHVSHEAPPLNLFTVGKTKAPITSQGFLKLTPDYSIADAPRVDVLVIGGGGIPLDDVELMEWFRKSAESAEVTLTVCTGAFPIAKLGFLDGAAITTWYDAIPRLQKIAPNAKVTDGRRYIDNGKFITTAGVSAGIDGALHLVARLFGRRVADETARYMEYHWSPESYLARNYQYLNPSTDDRGRALQLGEMHGEAKRWAEAAAVYTELTRANAADAEAWYLLGEVQSETKDYRKAIAAYEKASTSETYRRWALAQTARAYALLNDRAAAIAALDKAVEAGYRNRDGLVSDPAFAAYRDDAQVQKIVARIK
jgi:putative intracellular protease/amidase